jgi:hypothetical protein
MKESFHLLVGLLLVLTLLPFAQARPASVDLLLSEDVHPAVRFGAESLRSALERKGITARVTSRSSDGVRLIIAVRGDTILNSVRGERVKAPDTPESYALSVLGRDVVVVEGSDAAGAMYGALDLAEQIELSDTTNFVEKIKPGRKSPFLSVRGINTFLTAQGFDDPNSWYWSDSFWTRYLDMMARNRYNFLDLHGPFDLTIGWPNAFSYFVSLPDYPEVGVGPERAAKNLAQFRKIIRMAADRGIKVGFMNYTAAAPIGPWRTGRFWKDERYVPRTQEFLSGPKLEDYTRKAVKAFLRQIPELWMFGFRIGESGQPEDFYKVTYLEAIQDLPTTLNIYARTWVAEPHKVREIADLTRHHFYIEPKYNGEHLGLPYHAATGGRPYAPSGSYEDYTDYPRNYSIIWQIRANGTHRVFHWGWPEFARRTVRSCKFGDGVGFSMEPMNSYYPQDDYLHNNPQTDHHFADWIFEQQWFWYQVWGRTAFDPDVSDRVWAAEFERRFGAQAGPLVYRALVEGSKIVPFIYAYHNQGLDHQDMAPEFETGDHAQGVRGTIWQGERLVPFGGGNEAFLSVGVLDRTAMNDPASYVKEHLDNVGSGKMTPFEASEYLTAAASASERAIAEAAKLNPTSKKEFDCIRMDSEAVAALGRYYSNRILSATHLAFFQATDHHPELSEAYNCLYEAVKHWDRLSEVTEKHFGYVPELIRMRVYKFLWRDEGRSLGVLLEELNRMEAEYQSLNASHRRSIIGHVPPRRAKPGQPLPIIVSLATGGVAPRVHLFYQNSRQSAYTQVPLKLRNPFDRTWVGEIPAEAVVPGPLRYYFEAFGGKNGAYSGTLQYRPPYLVHISNDDARPVITHTPPGGPARGSSVLLSVDVKDDSAVSAVRVYYKRMPAYHEWVSIEMEKAGSNSYRARVPLTPEGILYYFEAIDESGNGANYPNFLKETPYFVIKGWDAGSDERSAERSGHGRRGR